MYMCKSLVQHMRINHWRISIAKYRHGYRAGGICQQVFSIEEECGTDPRYRTALTPARKFEKETERHPFCEVYSLRILRDATVSITNRWFACIQCSGKSHCVLLHPKYRRENSTVHQWTSVSRPLRRSHSRRYSRWRSNWRGKVLEEGALIGKYRRTFSEFAQRCVGAKV